MPDSSTLFSNKCNILAELWMDFREDEEFADFVEYNDLGLPLAYAVSNNLVSVEPSGKALIEESFDLFILGLEIEDTGFESLYDILG